MGSRLSSATFTATAVQVDCPHCGESLPSPNDSLFWTVNEIAKAIENQPARTCNSCDEPFVLRQQSKAHMDLGAAVRDLYRAGQDGG